MYLLRRPALDKRQIVLPLWSIWRHYKGICYNSFFWLTLHDRLECQILVKTAVFNIPVAFYSRVRKSFYQ